MGTLETHKPTIAMVVLQFTYAALSITTRAAFTEGMSPWVYVVYRQAIATIFMAPIAYFDHRRKPTAAALGVKSLSLIFLTSLIGVTMNQDLFFLGMYFTSSSITSAMSNLLPAITFLVAAFFRLEKVNIRSLHSMAKVFGTILCVAGAVSMTLIKGPKLLNTETPIFTPLFQSSARNWILGCVLLFCSIFCWSLWLILQVPMAASYPNHLSLSAWMCFFATLQSGILTLFIEPDARAWKLNSSIKIFSCFYAGIVGSAISFYMQSWCISQKGPLFCATFRPLCTVIVTISACLILHEQIYVGSLAGAIAVVGGLYIVLWSKAHDKGSSPRDTSMQIKSSSDASGDICKIDIKKPLLGNKLCVVDENETTH